jgi:hypothetical protein
MSASNRSNRSVSKDAREFLGRSVYLTSNACQVNDRIIIRIAYYDGELHDWSTRSAGARRKLDVFRDVVGGVS